MLTLNKLLSHTPFFVGGGGLECLKTKQYLLTLVTTHVCYMRLRLMRRPLKSEEYFCSQNVDPQYEQQCKKRRLLFYMCGTLINIAPLKTSQSDFMILDIMNGV